MHVHISNILEHCAAFSEVAAPHCVRLNMQAWKARTAKVKLVGPRAGAGGPTASTPLLPLSRGTAVLEASITGGMFATSQVLQVLQALGQESTGRLEQLWGRDRTHISAVDLFRDLLAVGVREQDCQRCLTALDDFGTREGCTTPSRKSYGAASTAHEVPQLRDTSSGFSWAGSRHFCAWVTANVEAVTRPDVDALVRLASQALHMLPTSARDEGDAEQTRDAFQLTADIMNALGRVCTHSATFSAHVAANFSVVQAGTALPRVAAGLDIFQVMFFF